MSQSMQEQAFGDALRALKHIPDELLPVLALAIIGEREARARQAGQTTAQQRDVPA